MIKVFIGYRRADSGGWVRPIDQRLEDELAATTFSNSTERGAEFELEFETRSRLPQCDVALVVIEEMSGA